MSNDHEVYQTAMAGYNAALIDENAKYQMAQVSGDTNEQVRASMALASLRAAKNEYHAMASQHAAAQQARPSNKHGLTEREQETARLSIPDTKGLPMLSNDEKEAIYVKNKERLAKMKANGTYSERRE